MSAIRDNHRHGTVAAFLRDAVKPGARLSFVSAYFTVPAWAALQSGDRPLDNIESLRFLFGEPSFLDNLDPEHVHSKRFTLRDQSLQLSEQTGVRAQARACARWIEEKRVEIRSIKRPDFLHGKLYFIDNSDKSKGLTHHAAILGSSNFTVNGLGLRENGQGDLGKAGNLELNIIADSDTARKELLEWFEELWGDLRTEKHKTGLVEDVRERVLTYLRGLYTDRDPQFVYFKTLLALFGRNLEDESRNADEVHRVLQNTAIWKSLYEFQQHGATGAINRIKAHNGCIIADSVGLGKTYEALAVIKYFELKGTQKSRVLVLCPKKLTENWTIYQGFRNHKQNPFPDDAFSFTVLAHTDLSRDSGFSNGVDLSGVQWGNFDLVVIDESHNFRNHGSERYRRSMDDIIKAGAQSGAHTKVLLLSATPVNVDLKDLGNQLSLITGENDSAFADSLGIRHLKTSLKDAQRSFVEWANNAGERRDPHKLHERLSGEFTNLLDGVSIARSRRQIEKHYASSLDAIGGFPKRRKPRSMYAPIDVQNRVLSYAKLDQELSNYQLAVFKPSTFVHPDFKHLYKDKTGVQNFSQEARERYLIDMMKVNFLKRLESSVCSFGVTMDRTVAKIDKLIAKLQRFDDDYADDLAPDIDPDDPDADPELLEALSTGTRLKFRLAHMRRDDWLAALKADRDQLLVLQRVVRRGWSWWSAIEIAAGRPLAGCPPSRMRRSPSRMRRSPSLTLRVRGVCGGR